MTSATVIFLDANVFIHAAGREHPEREPCRELIRRIDEGEVAANSSAEVLQEVLHVLSRRGRRREAARAVRDALAMFPGLLPVTRREIAMAAELVDREPGIEARDAVHAATMRNNGIATIASTDPVFDRIPELVRLSPADAVRR